MKPKLLPPVWFALNALAMWLLAKIPLLALPRSWWLTVILAAAGFVIATIALLAFLRTGTTADPPDPAQSRYLVTHGIYRASRNPMYLGMALILAAWQSGSPIPLPGLASPDSCLPLPAGKSCPKSACSKPNSAHPIAPIASKPGAGCKTASQ